MNMNIFIAINLIPTQKPQPSTRAKSTESLYMYMISHNEVELGREFW